MERVHTCNNHGTESIYHRFATNAGLSLLRASSVIAKDGKAKSSLKRFSVPRKRGNRTFEVLVRKMSRTAT